MEFAVDEGWRRLLGEWRYQLGLRVPERRGTRVGAFLCSEQEFFCGEPPTGFFICDCPEYAGVITGTAAPGQFAPGGFFMNMAMKVAVPYASIHEMEALAKAFIETLESIERADREACRRYFGPGTAHLVDLRHYMSAELQFRTLEATSLIVAARDSADAAVIMTAPTAAGVQSIYPLLETALSNRGVDPASVKSVLTTPSRDPVQDRICWALIEYYKAILEIPVPERELFIKYKLAQ